MASSQFFLLLGGALVLALFAHEASSIKCFECNSHIDARCAEKEPPAELEKDCSTLSSGSKYTFCRKIIQVIEFSVNGLPADTRTIRSCGFEVGNYKNRCYQRSGFGGRQEVCACETDNCNSAIVQKSSYGLILLAIIATIMVRF